MSSHDAIRSRRERSIQTLWFEPLSDRPHGLRALHTIVTCPLIRVASGFFGWLNLFLFGRNYRVGQGRISIAR